MTDFPSSYFFYNEQKNSCKLASCKVLKCSRVCVKFRVSVVSAKGHFLLAPLRLGGGGGVGGCHFCLLVKKGDDAKKICMMWADMKKKMPLLKYPLPSPISVNIINAALAIKQTVSQLRERINADQE